MLRIKLEEFVHMEMVIKSRKVVKVFLGVIIE